MCWIVVDLQYTNLGLHRSNMNKTIIKTTTVPDRPRDSRACNFNSFIKTQGLLKVTGSRIHCKYGNISETVQDRD